MNVVAALPTDVDIVVVGAGVAGLAAAAAVRGRGRCVVLEAGARSGGRVFTDRPALLGGVPFDHGASWLHDADRNPLARLARDAGLNVTEAGTRRSVVDGRLRDARDCPGRAAAWSRLEVEAESLLRPGMSDTTLGAVIAYLEPREWAGTVGTLEGTLIAAADPDRLSLRDWHANALNGQNLWVEDGMGPLVGACLPAAPDEIWLETPVQRIAWQRPHGRVAVTTPRGTLTCKACIVTVSTGVLAAGAIRFSPDLPDLVSDAIAGLPMGLLTKVALRAAGDDRLDLPSFCSVDRPVALGEAAMFFNAWPFGHDHLVGFVGGTAAWGLARAGNKAAEDFARSELRRLFGARADRAFRPGAVVTGWGTDPLTLGAYCYARPGAAAARRVLAQPLEGGRLLFAGEACHDGLAGTTAGAMLSGQEAAGHALRALP